MKKTILNLVLSLITTISFAQNVNFEWAKSIGGVSDDKENALIFDFAGNMYVIGNFEGTVDFDPSSSIFDLTSNGGKDIFIQKLDNNGNFIWAKSIGGLNNDFGLTVASDSNNNIYIAGGYTGTVDFDPNSNTFNITSISSVASDIFILKLTSNGDFVWAKSMGGSAGEFAKSITINSSQEIIVTGYFNGTVDFDPSISNLNLTSNGGADIYVQKLDTNGSLIWVNSVGGSTHDEGLSITTDLFDNIFITGYFQNTVDFDAGSGTTNLNSNGGKDFFIQKLDANGNFVWTKTIGGSSDDSGRSILVQNGDVFITGFYQNTVDFDPNTGVTSLTSMGGNDAFILKIDTNGNFSNTKSMGGTSNEIGIVIKSDNLGNIYTTGTFDGSADFDPNTGTLQLTPIGGIDVFIQKLDPNLNLIWAKSIGGVNDERVFSLSIDQNQNIYIAGHYSVTVDFDPNSSVFNLTSNGGFDVFTLKLNQTTTNINQNIAFNNVSIYPNPNQGIVNINLGDLKEVNIQVMDVTGKIIYTKNNIKTPTHQFEIDGAKGIYFITLQAQNEIQQYKIIKK